MTREQRAFDLLKLYVQLSRGGDLSSAKATWAERERLLAGERVWQPDPPRGPIRLMSLARRY